MRPLRLLVAAAVTAGLFVLPGISTAATKHIQAAGDPGSFHWEPDVRRIVKGDSIHWTNPTNADHRIVGYAGWDFEKALPQDESVLKKFRRRGVFKFRCTVASGTAFAHSTLNDGVCEGMCGKIRVRRP